MLSLISFTEHAQPQQPGDQAKGRHGEAGKAGDLRIMLRVTTSHFPNGAGNHERDSGCRSDRELREEPSKA